MGMRFVAVAEVSVTAFNIQMRAFSGLRPSSP
jgi:hypothetical protein